MDEEAKEQERLEMVRALIHGHILGQQVKNNFEIEKLVRRVVEIMRRPLRWIKWTEERDALLAEAAWTWMPLDDLRRVLNELPGPPLTKTDVTERLEDFYINHDSDDSRPGDSYLFCKEEALAIYQKELAEGTELIAVLRVMRRFMQRQLMLEMTHRQEEASERRRAVQDEKLMAFKAGADGGWFNIGDKNVKFYRMNGRLYRGTRTSDKKWEVCRVRSVEDSGGRMLGLYATPSEAKQALRTIAYEWERPLPKNAG